jgi:hypothetical protein
MAGGRGYEEERLGALLRMLRPAPAAWVEAAQELPEARASLDEIVARAEADAAFRAALIADLEATLAEDGFEPDGRIVAELRKRYTQS